MEDVPTALEVLESVVLGVVVGTSFNVGVALGGAAFDVDAGVMLAEALAEALADVLEVVSEMHENWSHLARRALRPAPWSFSAEWAIVTSLWKRWFVKSWLATNFRY